VGVVTSATSLNAEKIDRLKKLDLDVAIISFHGTRQVHDSVVGMPGAYDRAMENLRLFAQTFPTRPPMINFIISERSVPVLRDFLDEALLLDNVIIRLSHLNFLTADEIARQKIYWKERFPDTPLDILSYAYDCDTTRFIEVQNILKEPKYETVFTKPILSDSDFANWYSNDFTLGTRCVFIWRSTFLNANGDVYPCQFLYIQMGNIRKDRMEDIWNNDLYQTFRQTLKDGLMPGCSRCCKL
jgi:MoaA/NifB/PqqE/SkfB family radical SAM enzyme